MPKASQNTQPPTNNPVPPLKKTKLSNVRDWVFSMEIPDNLPKTIPENIFKLAKSTATVGFGIPAAAGAGFSAGVVWGTFSFLQILFKTLMGDKNPFFIAIDESFFKPFNGYVASAGMAVCNFEWKQIQECAKWALNENSEIVTAAKKDATTEQIEQAGEIKKAIENSDSFTRLAELTGVNPDELYSKSMGLSRGEENRESGPSR